MGALGKAQKQNDYFAITNKPAHPVHVRSAYRWARKRADKPGAPLVNTCALSAHSTCALDRLGHVAPGAWECVRNENEAPARLGFYGGRVANQVEFFCL